jgi:pimeloyl-ACP methyl ester carboxylesterase
VKTSTYGSGELKYWIFEPDSPTPDSAPVVVFNHGFLATDPAYYIGWIKHLTRNGNIVIFPAYQKMFTSPGSFTDNAITIVKNALSELESGRHVTPELNNLAVIGHSAGGAIAINVAARAAKAGLPALKALILVEASDGSDILQGGMFETDAFSGLPNTLLLAIVGDKDNIAGSAFSEKAIKDSTKIPAANKNMIVLHSDDYGTPALKADHIAALAPELPSGDTLTDISMELWGAKIDAIDYYGFWKAADGLIGTAFGDNTMRKYALENSPELRYMGEWSDGTPVKESEMKNE